jgi:hypothetical protein
MRSVNHGQFRNYIVIKVFLTTLTSTCKLIYFILIIPRVEAGKNTSTVIPSSRKRRQKGKPIISGETVPADLTEG